MKVRINMRPPPVPMHLGCQRRNLCNGHALPLVQSSMNSPHSQCKDTTCWCQLAPLEGQASARWPATLAALLSVAVYLVAVHLGHPSLGQVLVTGLGVAVVRLWFSTWSRVTVDPDAQMVTDRAWFGLRPRRVPFAEFESVRVHQRRWLHDAASTIVLCHGDGETVVFQRFVSRQFEANQLALQVARTLGCPRVVHWVNGHTTTVASDQS